MKTWFAVGLVAAVLVGGQAARAGQLTAEDQKIYRQAFDAANHDHFEWAMAGAQKAHDKLLVKVIRWMTYIEPNSGASFADITAFVRANPNWPQIPTLMRRAEEAITAATPDQAVMEWFAAYPPLTVDGAMAYGKALINAGQTEKAEALVRQAWISGNFGPIQERQFLAAFRDLLKDDDQTARLDRLLWEHQDSAAELQLARVPEGWRQLARARMALEDAASNGEALAAAVPAGLKDDPGLIYELVHYRRTHDRDEDAVALLQHPSHDKAHPEMWWTERAILARRALQAGRISEAFDIARNHGQATGAGFADAEWLSGWIALRFLDDRQVALAHFTGMYERVSTAQSRARAAYWAGRAADALQRPDEANRWFGLAARHVTTFYGQLAAARLDAEDRGPLPGDPAPTAEEIRRFDHHELVRVARMLGEIKETDLVRPFLLRMNEMAQTVGERALAADLAASLGRPDIAVLVAKRAERDGVSLTGSGYPIPALRAAELPERALVLGLIRQESAFHYEAVSTAGARGLMQLMPPTAAKVAKALGVVFKKREALAKALTHDPGLNVKLGSAYLNDLLNDFNGSYILSVAAYNAGPARVKRWIRDMGDPRNPEVDAVDWIESIPFAETRNYVQRVLEGVQVYRRRLGGTNLALTLDRDLKR